MLLLQAVFQPHVSLTRKLPTNCLSVFDHLVGLLLKVLKHFTSVKLAFRVQIWIKYNLKIYGEKQKKMVILLFKINHLQAKESLQAKEDL